MFHDDVFLESGILKPRRIVADPLESGILKPRRIVADPILETYAVQILL